MFTDRRLRPLLGTLVEITASSRSTNKAVDAAFARIADIHDALSFQSPTSELCQLNRYAAQHAVQVSPMLHEVLLQALDIARASDGAFDPTVGGQLVRAGLMPAPSNDAVDLTASYLDVLVHGNEVMFAKPLWLDFSGIAKGYAVDQAVRVLQHRGAHSGVVNAGGDLRVFGPQPHVIVLRDAAGGLSKHVLELREQAIATSGGALHWRESSNGQASPTLIHRGQFLTNPQRSVSVVAEQALLADALTKVAIFASDADLVLRRFGAYQIAQGNTASTFAFKEHQRVA
jgi:FAD:protein FMN transferase